MARARANEPREWQEGQAKARDARSLVAMQVTELLQERDMTGSLEEFARRVREVGEARASGDREVLRSAMMEAGVAALAFCVELDLR